MRPKKISKFSQKSDESGGFSIRNGVVQRRHAEVLRGFVDRDFAGEKVRVAISICPFAVRVTSTAAFDEAGLHFLVTLPVRSFLLLHVLAGIHQSDVAQDAAFTVRVLFVTADERGINGGNVRLKYRKTEWN